MAWTRWPSQCESYPLQRVLTAHTSVSFFGGPPQNGGGFPSGFPQNATHPSGHVFAYPDLNSRGASPLRSPALEAPSCEAAAELTKVRRASVVVHKQPLRRFKKAPVLQGVTFGPSLACFLMQDWHRSLICAFGCCDGSTRIQSSSGVVADSGRFLLLQSTTTGKFVYMFFCTNHFSPEKWFGIVGAPLRALGALKVPSPSGSVSSALAWHLTGDLPVGGRVTRTGQGSLARLPCSRRWLQLCPLFKGRLADKPTKQEVKKTSRTEDGFVCHFIESF